MRLVIAGFRIVLALDHPSLAARAGERYAGFLATDDGPVDLALRVSVDAARTPPGAHPVHVDNPAVQAEGDLDRAALLGTGFAGEFDWVRRAGRAVVPDALAYLDQFVRVGLGVGLLREGATLLHASGVLRDRFGIAFSGPSGAGKTTAARLSRAAGLTVLADEMLVFRRSGFGARFHGTPFWDGAAASGPCGALLLLEQAPAHAVAQLAPAQALPRLLAAGGAPLDLPSVHEAFFAACGEVLRRVPAYLLRFAPDAGFWNVLDRLPEFAFFRPPARTHGSRRALTPAPAPLTVLRPARGPSR